jgi:hypothetical protein
MKYRILFPACVALLVISIIINILQARSIWTSQEDLDSATGKAGVARGAQVPLEFGARALDGKWVTIRFSSEPNPTVLYVLRPSCVWCRRNSESINALARQASSRFRIIGLSLSDDGLKSFVEDHHVTFPVYTGLSYDTIKSLGIVGTPETIVISPAATVLEAWTGAYVGAHRLLAEKVFSIRLAETVPST